MKIKTKDAGKKVETAKVAAKPAKQAVKMPVAKKAAAKTTRVTFSVRAEVGSKVFLAGSFNDWDPTAKEMTDKAGDGVFTVTLSLPAGSHQYKYVIDGTWCADPECSDWVQNDHGTLNSVKHVS